MAFNNYYYYSATKWKSVVHERYRACVVEALVIETIDNGRVLTHCAHMIDHYLSSLNIIFFRSRKKSIKFELIRGDRTEVSRGEQIVSER